ncbi:hypothetical protein IEN85_22285 [Pelagicoccus sp. NFK12]|uniref:Uncharacterized protein n=1 Tax=Pelagicoccus enzymogenes TaxID=2773457 RepID=A0A927FCC3_9BACT|nr:hypothetical protein [Pelagicoccus enzymogenes]MBD5782244.1 hypothetical protein [Pelagicoccus enzymogenes]
MKRRRVPVLSERGKVYSLVLLFVSSLIVWQLTKLTNDYSETSSHTIRIKEALEPYLYHKPDELPPGTIERETDYLAGHKEGWYTIMRTSHHSPDSDERPQPPYQLPEKFFDESDDHLTIYERGFRDGCFEADETVRRIHFYSPRELRKDMRRAFSSIIVRDTPKAVLHHLKEIGYDFDTL